MHRFIHAGILLVSGEVIINNIDLSFPGACFFNTQSGNSEPITLIHTLRFYWQQQRYQGFFFSRSFSHSLIV